MKRIIKAFRTGDSIPENAYDYLGSLPIMVQEPVADTIPPKTIVEHYFIVEVKDDQPQN